MKCSIVICGLLLAMQSLAANNARLLDKVGVSQELLATIKGHLASIATKSATAVRGAAIGSALLLVVGGTADSSDDYWGNEDTRTKRLERSYITASLLGGYNDRSSASDELTVGLSIDTLLRRGDRRLHVKWGIRSTIAEETADDGYTSAEDYLGRMTYATYYGDNGLGYISANAAQYSSIKRQVAITISPIGLTTEDSFGDGLLGHGSELQLSLEAGWLGESHYYRSSDGFNFEGFNFEGFNDGLNISSLIASLYALVRIEGVSIGDVTGAGEASLLNHLFLIVPKMNLEYRGFIYADDGFSDYGYTLEASVYPIRWLGVSAEWSKTGDGEAYEQYLAALTFDFDL